MKKILCLTLALLAMIACLTSCNFNFTGSGLTTETETTAKVEAMMTALATSKKSDALALIHANATEKADGSIDQMIEFIDGRRVSSMELTGINVTSSVGSNGNMRQEQVSYRVALSDGSTIYLTAVYLSNNLGEGFVSFQIVLGMI